MSDVKPGRHSLLDLSVLGSEEQDIANKMANTWFLTWAKASTFKGSDYYFLIAKPTHRITEDFSITREVLVLFTPYREFQPRSLDFVDKTIFEYNNRLDKLCVILISKDPLIRDKIREFSMRENESKIYIPFSYSDFASAGNESTDVVMRRLKEFIYDRDLFAFDSPLRSDNYFFGRSREIQTLYGKYKAGENTCIFGLRRIGKTSALFALQRMLKLRGEPYVFVDCSETAFHRRRWYESLYLIVESLAKNEAMEGVSYHEEREYTEKNASRYFELDILSFSKKVSGQRILIILDEIENITFGLSPSEHWSTDRDYIFFWQTIRSIYQKNADAFSFIIAGVNPVALETPLVNGYDNPIYRLMTPQYLSLFTEEDVTEMVSSIGNYMGLKWDSEIYTYLTDDFGGHPFLTRQVCSRIHQSITNPRPTRVTKFSYQNEKESYARAIEDYVELIVNVLKQRYTVEYELLELLALGDQKTFNDFASGALIEHLKGYGLVSEDNKQFHFRIAVVERYLKRSSKRPIIPATREEKWKEISTARNALEVKLRKVVRLVLKAAFGENQAKARVLGIISKPSQKTALAGMPFDEMFSTHMYFDDLKKLIEKEWDSFRHIFGSERENFKFHMGFINSHRADAHANEISDEDVATLQASLSWVHKRLLNYLE